jgi:hypothetical protein
MEIPEEMRERINANGQRIWQLMREVEMLRIETGKLFAIAQALAELIDSVYMVDKEKFGRGLIYLNRRCESHLQQHEMAMLEIRTKADQLNDLTGGLLDLYKEQVAETDDEVLSAAILHLNENGIY